MPIQKVYKNINPTIDIHNTKSIIATSNDFVVPTKYFNNTLRTTKGAISNLLKTSNYARYAFRVKNESKLAFNEVNITKGFLSLRGFFRFYLKQSVFKFI